MTFNVKLRDGSKKELRDGSKKKLWDGLKNPCHQTSHPFYYIFRPHKDQNTPTLSKILLVTSPLDPPLPLQLVTISVPL